MNIELFKLILVGSIGYFIGSISFAVLIAKKHGINILKEGSGNPGATNVKRVLGKGPGNIVFALDFMKGAMAAVIPYILFGDLNRELYSIIGLLGAIVGHSFSMFIGFKGGKGVATTMGGLMVIMPVSLLIGLLVWWIIFLLTRYVSLASILFGISLPITVWAFKGSLAQRNFAILLMLVILIRHRSNIYRLVQGEENKFVKK